jgi:hypothetical protein
MYSVSIIVSIISSGFSVIVGSSTISGSWLASSIASSIDQVAVTTISSATVSSSSITNARSTVSSCNVQISGISTLLLGRK